MVVKQTRYIAVRTQGRIFWTSCRLKTTGSFFSRGGRRSLKQVQLRWSVFWKKNLMPHRARVVNHPRQGMDPRVRISPLRKEQDARTSGNQPDQTNDSPIREAD